MFAPTYFAPTYFAPTYFLRGGAAAFVSFVPPDISVQSRVAVSRTLICNMALTYLDVDTVESLDEVSPQASQCNLWYDYTRLQALELQDWNFAKRRLTLTTHADDPPDEAWAYRYEYPEDCIIIRKLESSTPNVVLTPRGFVVLDAESRADAIPFIVEHSSAEGTESILTSLDNAIAVYTKDQKDVALFSPNFVRLLSTMLAANMAYPLTGRLETEEKMNERALRLQRTATALNANEQMQLPPRNAPWVRDRE